MYLGWLEHFFLMQWLRFCSETAKHVTSAALRPKCIEEAQRSDSLWSLLCGTGAVF